MGTLSKRDLTAAAAIALAGCLDADASGPSSREPRDAVSVPAEWSGFSWVVEDQLAGMPRLGAGSTRDQHLAFLAEQEIDLLVSLTAEGTDPDAAAAYGVSVLHLPVKDFSAPTLDQLFEFTAIAHQVIDEGGRVGVHCTAGLGRTGTFLSAYFVTTGMTADEAIAHVRELRPGSVETKVQEQAVHDFDVALSRAPR